MSGEPQKTKSVAEVMTSRLTMVDEHMPVLSALQTMRDRRISSVIVSETGTARGILTERDLVRWLHMRLDLSNVPCGKLMHSPLISLPSTASYLEAHHVMAQRNIRHLAVVEDDGRVVGIVTEGDILRHLGVEYFTQFKEVSGVMSRDLCMMSPDQTVAEAVERMNSGGYACVLVVDTDQRPIGILTERDIVRLSENGNAPMDSSLRAVASRPVRTVSVKSHLHEAVVGMENSRIRRLAVVDDSGRLCGILSQHEVVKGLENQYVGFLKRLVLQQNRESTPPPVVNDHSLLTSVLGSTTDLATVITDADFNITFCNEAASSILRLTKETILGRPLRDMLTDLGLDSLELSLQVLQLKGELTLDSVLSQDGQIRHLQLRLKLLSQGKDQVQGCMLVARDTSHEHQAQEALLAERDFSDAVIAGLPELFYLVDSDYNLIRWNTAWSNLMGLDSRTMHSGMPLAGLRAVGGDQLLSTICETFDEGEADVEVQIRQPDGQFVYYQHNLRRADIGRKHYVIGTAVNITDRKRSLERAEHLARCDSLTGLANRHHFQTRLSVMLEHHKVEGGAMALLFIDLDNFKDVNDTLGHPVGDLLLQSVASRMEFMMTERDFLARLGGDEFAVIIDGVRDRNQVARYAQALIRKLQEPFNVEEHQLFIGASIGIAFYPGESKNADEMLAHADLAMYRAKSSGRNQWRFFERSMAERMRHRRSLEHDMRGALEERQFDVWFQPKILLRNDTVESCEALIRWFHPVRGMVLPSEFVPLAETNGLIAPMGEWVLHTACAQACRWDHWGAPSVAVNLSPVQFWRHDVVNAIRRALDDTGLPPERLEVEVTEGTVMGDSDHAAEILCQIRDMGVSISLDDFGTGYSSLAYLKKFPFNTLKIDRSFVITVDQDPQAAAIVQAIITLGQSLGMKLVAEGAETKEQVDLLREKGCDMIQGYFYSKPLNSEDFISYLRQSR